MTSISPCRILTAAVLLACLALAAVPAQAATFGAVRPVEKIAAEEGFLLNLWGFVAGLFEKAGMSIDPDGKPEEAGMTIDPDGVDSDSGEEGMTIDPNG